MDCPDLQMRTREFSLRVVKMVKAMESDLASVTIARQVIRCGTSVGANYLAACIAKSRRDFINKLRICAEEADETAFWSDLLISSDLFSESKVLPLMKEANELTSIFLASIKTARDNEKKSK